ncbi:MAG: YfiR family protein [Planctomycetota bacterium]|nr:MAG: YfiR family protein [Planctomycetota bacterium]
MVGKVGRAMSSDAPNSPMLTVAESESFTKSGGVIRLFVEQNKVQFEVNTDAAARAKLKLSSKLLGLARVVRDAAAPKDR